MLASAHFFPVADALVVVRVRHHPVRRALEDHQAFDVGRDARADLMARCAGADHGDALSAPVEIAVPLRGVEGRPGERVEPGNVRQFRPVQHADGGDQHTGREACARVASPALRAVMRQARVGLVIARLDHFGAEPDMFSQIVFVGDSLQNNSRARRAWRRNATSRDWARTHRNRNGSGVSTPQPG